MNIIVYEQHSDALDKTTMLLNKYGFKAVASTSKMGRLQDLVAEFDSSIAFLNPATIAFMRGKEILEKSQCPLSRKTELASSISVLASFGYPPLISEALWKTVVNLVNEQYESGPACVNAGVCLQDHCLALPRGWETLPTAWLVVLPGIIQTLLHTLWYESNYLFISEVRQNQGALDIEFFCENIKNTKKINTLCNLSRVFINKHIYPSRWAPILPLHKHEIHKTHPEYRVELEIPHAS